ncbi:hypothetical protein RDI58_025027 [Solanum bulbocastanum]|uniref:Uncharacterized protein n=1 Tax=Solanum bulbocastanum TaxID=147425 RepID=A0AAN8T2A7_SOLBU
MLAIQLPAMTGCQPLPAKLCQLSTRLGQVVPESKFWWIFLQTCQKKFTE